MGGSPLDRRQVTGREGWSLTHTPRICVAGVGAHHAPCGLRRLIEFARCKTRTSALLAWRISRSSSPSSARTFPTSAAWRAAQTGPAALSIQTSAKSPYDDEILPDGFLCAYRAGEIDQPDNRALRAAHELQVPLVYFIGTRPGWYKPVFPCFVSADDPPRRMVTVTPGELRGPVDEPAPVPLDDPIERRYAVRQTRMRAFPWPSRSGVQQPVRDLSPAGTPSA